MRTSFGRSFGFGYSDTSCSGPGSPSSTVRVETRSCAPAGGPSLVQTSACIGAIFWRTVDLTGGTVVSTSQAAPRLSFQNESRSSTSTRSVVTGIARWIVEDGYKRARLGEGHRWPSSKSRQIALEYDGFDICKHTQTKEQASTHTEQMLLDGDRLLVQDAPQ